MQQLQQSERSARSWLRSLAGFITLAALAQGVIGVHAASEIDLTELDRRVQENAPEVRARLLEVQSAQRAAQQKGVWSNPQLSFELGKSQQNGSHGLTAELGLTQAVPFPGKRSAAVRVSEIEARLESFQAEQAKLAVQHAARLTAVKLAALKAVAGHSEKRRSRFNLIREHLRSRPLGSPIQKVEASLIEGEIRDISRSFSELERDVREAELELQTFLSGATSKEMVGVRVDWFKTVELPLPPQSSSSSEFSTAGRKNAELRFERAQADRLWAGRSAWPDVTLGLLARTERVKPANDFFAFSIGIPLPFWDRNQHVVGAAEAKEEAERIRLEAQSWLAERELQMAWNRLKAAHQVLALYPLSLVEALERKFEEADQEFRKGRVTAASLLQLDAQVHRSVDDVYMVRLNYLAELSRYYLLISQRLEWGR